MVTEIMAAPYTSLSTYTGLAMEAVRTSMLPRARNNVQKLVILLADGLSADRMLLYSEADSMKLNQCLTDVSEVHSERSHVKVDFDKYRISIKNKKEHVNNAI
jgi:hypothetical protein